MDFRPVDDNAIYYTMGDQTFVFQFPDNTENRNVTTPTVLFGIPGVTKSNLKSFNEYVTCYKFFYSTVHQVHSVASGGFKGSGRNQLTDVTVIIATDPHRGDILTNLSEGQTIPEISILNVMWTGNKTPMIKAEDKFKNAVVVKHTEARYCTLFTFRCTEMLMKINQFKQSDGTLEGQNEVRFNYEKNTPASELKASAQPK